MKLSLRKLSFWDFAIAAGALTLCGVLWAQNSKNPIEVALLRWYQANTATQFNTCSAPSVLAFDGKHVWVTCSSTGTLQEYNASDGAPVAAVTSVVGAGLLFDSLLYDGKNIWAAASPAGAVVRINVSAVNTTSGCSFAGGGCACSSLGAGCTPVTNVGFGATGLTFDGKNVWVANSPTNLSYIVANATNPTATTVTLTTACTQPLFLAFDGTNLWVPCRQSNSVQVQLVNVNTGALTQQAVLTGMTSPSGLTYDGGNMWVSGGSSLYQVSRLTGGGYAVSSAYAVPQGGGGGTAYDSKYLWVGDYSTSMVTKLLPGGPITMTGQVPNISLVSSYMGGLANPESPAFDGGNIWFANSGGSTVSKF